MLSLTKMTQQQQHLNNMEPHQLRVVEEKKELDLKIKNLQIFSEEAGEIWQSLSINEKEDLKEQLKHMQVYTHILQKRINRF